MPRSNFHLPLEQTAILIFTVIISGVISGCSEKNEYVEPPAPEVTVSKPQVQNVTDYLEFTGTTRAVTQIDIRARVEGFLESVHFQDGDFIKKGALLFVIDPKPSNMMANAARGMKPETAVTQAETLTKAIFEKWRKKGLVGGTR